VPVADGPRSGDRPVDEIRADRERVLRGEDQRPIALRKDARAAGVDEQDGVPSAAGTGPVRRHPDRAAARPRGPRGPGRPRRDSVAARGPRHRAGCRLPGHPPTRRCPSTTRDRTPAGTPGRGGSVRPPPWCRAVRPSPRPAPADPPAGAPQVPEGGTRTRSIHTPRLPTNPAARSPSSLTVRGPPASSACKRSALANIAASPPPDATGRRDAQARRALRTPSS
jgi:hypothetical protein